MFRKRVLDGEVLSGVWNVLGSQVASDVSGRAGFDWVLLDQEHGLGAADSLLGQVLVLRGTPAAPIVRVAWNEPWLVKRALDLGAAGIMFPMVDDAEQARRAVAAMRYPPEGIRGMTTMSPPADFQPPSKAYFETANRELVAVVQIETPRAVENAEAIAAVEGVDVLFVGPLDLSANMGIVCESDHPRLRDAFSAVAEACRKHGKAAGTLLARPEQIELFVKQGYTFLALGSDGSILANGLRAFAAAFGEHRKT